MLALQIAATTLGGDRRQLRDAVLGLARHRPLGDVTRMLCLVATGDDVYVVPIQKQRPGHARGLRGHGVAATVVAHLSGHSHLDRYAQRQPRTVT